MPPRVLVLNSFIKGWNVLKWLAADGFAVNAGHSSPDAPGLYSKRVVDPAANLVYPDPKKNEKEFVEAVIDHLQRHRFDIVLPVNAGEMMALAKHKDRIETYTRFPFEPFAKLLLLHDKKYFFELVGGILSDAILPHSWSIGNQTPPITDILSSAGLVGLPYQSMEDFITTEHFLNAVPGLIFPVMVKARRSTSAVGIYRVNNAKELCASCAKLGEADIIVQEFLEGRGAGISYIRWNRPPLLEFFGHRRVREYPISGGASTSREPWVCDSHPMNAALRSVLERLDWHGVVMFELKETAGGEFKLLEANPRFWGSVPLAMANGVDFPALLCRAALGMEIPKVIKTNTVRARILFSDTLSVVLNVLRGRRVIWNLTDYFNFQNLYLDDIDFKDWPAMRRIFVKMFKELWRRVV